MTYVIRAVGVTAAVLLLAVAAAAQHQHQAGGHALGKVHFETSCQPDVRDSFDRAIALLHSFEFGSAIEGFSGVLQKDPSCAMAQWGIALSRWSNPFAGLKGRAVLEPGREAAVRERCISGTALHPVLPPWPDLRI